MTNSDKYNVNFFRPMSDHARANRKLVLTLAIIWAVGVFGFQFALMLLNEPTPEKSYTTFESVWPAVVEDASATIEMKQDFSRVLLSVLGKNIAVKDHHKAILKEALSWAVYSMQADTLKNVFQKELDEKSIQTAVQSIGLTSTGMDRIMIDLVRFSLQKVENDQISAESKAALPDIMELYLVHNQNIFTKARFLGFPFHYWYTAQFLLIMFVFLCLTYAVVTDKMNKRFDFVEEA
ncbi:MAG: hypothetical protein B6244_13930 [Candidatus Cloacimonetes bacterium 4572_55]|nr:MAG: hypothetical protein B6244_13930 [Candidatus Cloacimonetes bacterium 4572_55]